MARPVPPDALRRRCDLSGLDFETTASLPELEGAPGQERALEALEFGMDMEAPGYNLFVLGPTGTNHELVTQNYLASSDLVDTSIKLLDDFHDGLVMIAEGEADFMIQAAGDFLLVGNLGCIYRLEGLYVVFIQQTGQLPITTHVLPAAI